MQFQPLAEARGFLYCYPDGTIDRWGYQFWNATDACCDFGNSGVDDAGYLRGVIEEIAGGSPWTESGSILVGHSNGGFMAYRMACQSADLIAGIAGSGGHDVPGPQPLPTFRARQYPPHPRHGRLNVFLRWWRACHYHSRFSIRRICLRFPARCRPSRLWAGYNGASGPVTDPAPSLDLTTDVPGLDTVVTRYTTYPPGGAVELWTINGGGHIPTLSSQFSPRVIDWLLAHPKP